MSEYKNDYLPFNNSVESGIRLLAILNQSYPRSIDIAKILYYDYMLVHSSDFDEEVSSLHPSIPYRRGELLVRKPIIQKGLELLISRGLIEIVYSPEGLQYRASEYSAPFVESLSTPYSLQLIDRAEWIKKNYIDFNISQLHNLLDMPNDTFNLEILD